MNATLLNSKPYGWLITAISILLVILVTPSAQGGVVLTTLYSFAGGSDGSSPKSKLLDGKNGYFYGTTTSGGLYGLGTIFKITSTGVLTTLVSFNGSNGYYSQSGLIQGSDGNIYGTTLGGGTSYD